MTLATENSRMDYEGTGSQNTYPYTFKIFSASDLRVIRVDTAGAETVLALNVDYTVTGAGAVTGGNVVLSTNLPSGYRLTIRRVRPVLQETDIRNQGAFYPEIHEDAFDHQVMLVQQQKDEMNRSLKLPETEAGTAEKTTLPSETDRAGKVLGFDANGAPVSVTNVPTSGITIASFMETFLDDISAEEARGTLKVDNPIGEESSRPTFGNPGRLFFNTTTNTIQRDSGSAWVDVVTAGIGGWVSVPATLTYNSSTSVNSSVSLEGIVQVGDKIRFYNNSETKYFSVSSVSGANLGITGGSDYLVVNAPITNAFYSSDLSPAGFPATFSYDPATFVGFSSFTKKYIRFRVDGRIVKLWFQVHGTSNSLYTYFDAPIAPVNGFSRSNPLTYTINNNVYGREGAAMTRSLENFIYFLVQAVDIDFVPTQWVDSGNKGFAGFLEYEI